VKRGGRRLAALALALALGVAGVTVGEELPSWPHEQQALLQQVEEQLITVQHQLFKARQQHDTAALEAYGNQFRALQDQRRQLIELTRNQLPSH
jgi:hypothetical protein